MSDPAPQLAPRATPHAWLMLGGAFATFAVGASMLHAYTVFLRVYIEEFGWSRGDASIAYSVSQLVSGIGESRIE